MKFRATVGPDGKLQSPPSRGAWIEIQSTQYFWGISMCRPPRGGRGLKFIKHKTVRKAGRVAPLAGGVD